MASARKPIRVLICNQHTMFRDGIKALLARGRAIQIVGEASTARGAIHLLGRVHPDVVLLDTFGPDLSGPEATKQIKAVDPGIQVLIVSLDDDKPMVSRCLSAGAAGYVANSNRSLQLRHAIDVAYRFAPRHESYPRRERAR
jgi:DNA-binding NarL/FixJ family response regulator